MNIRNTKPNQIIITLNPDCTRIESISLIPKAFRFIEPTMALMAACFRVSHWGSIRHLCQYQGQPLVRDARKEAGAE